MTSKCKTCGLLEKQHSRFGPKCKKFIPNEDVTPHFFQMKTQKQKENFWMIATMVFAFLFLFSMIYFSITSPLESPYDSFCKAQGLDYAQADPLSQKFICCNTFTSYDNDREMIVRTEGCSSPFDFKVAG